MATASPSLYLGAMVEPKERSTQSQCYFGIYSTPDLKNDINECEKVSEKKNKSLKNGIEGIKETP